MALHFFYYTARVLFSILEKRGAKFLFIEICLVLFCLSQILICNQKFANLCFRNNIENKEIEKIIYSVFYCLLFFSTALLSRYLSRSVTPEKSKINVLKISLQKLYPKKLHYISDPINNPAYFIKKNYESFSGKKSVRVGIIDFTWLLIMGLAYSGLIYCQQFEVFKNPVQPFQNSNYYQLYYDEIKFLLQESINLALILGTILGVCMTIIWGGEIWRKNDHKSVSDYKLTTLGAMRMVVAFFAVVISEIIWISAPLYLKLSSIKEIQSTIIIN